jgi:ABC-type nitrate/sulfonate/bicarbonate transport system ATPase subunit
MAQLKKKEIEQTKEFTSEKSGQKYVFQKVAPVDWLDILDEVESEKKGQRKRLYSQVFEHIVVQPKMALTDFEDFGEMDEVATAAIRFQQGK